MYKMRKWDNAKVVRKCVENAKDENAKVTVKINGRDTSIGVFFSLSPCDISLC